MLNSRQLLRIASLLRLLTWLVDVTNPGEIEELVQRCENEARMRKQEEMSMPELPDWWDDMPEVDYE